MFYRLGLPVVIGYGLTEACTVATVNDLAPFRGDSVGKGHWSRFHRFFSHYVWSLDDLCLVLARLLGFVAPAA